MLWKRNRKKHWVVKPGELMRSCVCRVKFGLYFGDVQVTKAFESGEWLHKCVLGKLLRQGMWRTDLEGANQGGSATVGKETG